MNRRTFLSSIAVSFALPAAPSKQNVLMIAVDDLNDWVGCLGGYPGVKTPNIDRLAKRGMLFTNSHCAAPVCNPSRAAIMTGIRPSTSGVYENQQPMRKSAALRDAVSLTQHFRANGYRVIGGGKIYHGGFPDPASWDEYFPSQMKTKPADPMPKVKPANGMKRGHFDWAPLAEGEPEMGDMKVAEWAAGELSRAQEKPLFLACGIFRPHLPWYVPQKYFDMYPLDKIELPPVKEDDLEDVPAVGKHLALRSGDHKAVRDHNKWREAVQAYLACITFADAAIGRVLDALDKGPHAKNTTVMLWSDHGWHLGEKLHWRKFALWEEATRNVFIVAAPGVTKAGGQCARTVDMTSVYPTLTELCGLPERKGLDGVSLVPLLKNPEAKWDRPAITTYERGNHAVRSERWRYIRYHDGTEELYDHKRDPQEWTNLAGKPETAKVKAEHARWLPKVDAPDSLKERGLPDL